MDLIEAMFYAFLFIVCYAAVRAAEKIFAD